ncbi:hypothetical protein N7452_003423 [Penicillium brevicompactum]|uniref:Ribosomal protein L19 n=1 Tax=Penicillium brevicompactum TaxID=5074 RepID=A0A9W9QV12_PENBR|nr:hypothetical protein N7452_003423 [Penicillium brevicompactum]
MAALPAMRPLGCLRSLMRASEPLQPMINRRFISTAYSKRPERVPLPSDMPPQFLSQIPPRFRPDPGEYFEVNSMLDLAFTNQQFLNRASTYQNLPCSPSTRKACKDPIAAVTESQLAVLDPKGDRKAMFDYRRNPRSVKPGDIVRVTFKNGDPFNGVVLSIKLRGIETSFLLRNELTRVAVEMSVKVFSPNVNSVEIVQRSEKKRRRARLYFMRDRKHDRRSVENIVANYVRQKKAFLGGGNRRR